MVGSAAYALRRSRKRDIMATEWLRTRGNRLETESGRAIRLRGANIINFEYGRDPQLFDYPAVERLLGAPPLGWGGNCVSLGFAADPVLSNDSAYLAYLDSMSARVKARDNSYIIFFYRSDARNGAQPTLFGDKAVRALSTLAGRYLGDPHVLYGLQVEPHDVRWDQIKAASIPAIDTIRQINPKAVICIPGRQFSRYIYEQLYDPISRPNLVFSSHPYDLLADIRAKYRLPELSAQFPVILSEFGLGPRPRADLIGLLDLADSLGLHYTPWVFNFVDSIVNLRLVTAGPPDFPPSEPYGAIIRSYLQVAEPAPPFDPMKAGALLMDAGQKLIDAGRTMRNEA